MKPEKTSLRDRALALLTDSGGPLSMRELVGALELEGADRRELKSVLQHLLSEGLIQKGRGGRVSLSAKQDLPVGRLTVNPAGYGFVVLENARAGQADVFVAAVNIREAQHGDRVVVKVEATTPKGPEGRIVSVLERGQQRIVGRYESDGKLGGHVVPFDRRVLHEMEIPPGDQGEAQPGDMVVAEMTRPPVAHRSPRGRVNRVLGRIEDPGVDLKVVMAKHDLPESFSLEVEAEAEAMARSVSAEEAASRTDFRPWLTVTVDPVTARDHDDAISLDRMGNGNWLLAVHIADVAHYVREGTALDAEAYARGTSIYFPGTVVPMLPHALSSGICSLVEGQDRLTQSVVLEIDPQGRVLRYEMHDGVIRSAAKLSYQQMQKVVDGDLPTRDLLAHLVPLLLRMDELRQAMSAERHRRGSLDFDLPEPKLVFDDGLLVGIVAEERLSSMRAIEEFMLAANEAVADSVSKAGVGALYRVHEQPDPKKVEEFCDLVASLGYSVPTTLEEIRPQDFQSVLRQLEGKPEQKLVSSLLLRTMRLARYHAENLGHFGLATESYAHFTSPIRRYPDLIVHRALRAMRHGRPLAHLTGPVLDEMGLHLSDRERKADEAERELTEWKKVRFMADKLGQTFHGFITGVASYGLFLELEEVYVQGRVHVTTMTDDFYVLNEKAHLLKGENNGRAYRLGDRVEVQVVKVDLERRQIDLALTDVLARATLKHGDRSDRGDRGGRGDHDASPRASLSKSTAASRRSSGTGRRSSSEGRAGKAVGSGTSRRKPPNGFSSGSGAGSGASSRSSADSRSGGRSASGRSGAAGSGSSRKPAAKGSSSRGPRGRR